MKQKTEEELVAEIETNLAAIGKSKGAGATAAYSLLLKMKGLVDKNSKELFELTADDYHLIEQQAQRELDDGVLPYLGREGEVQVEPSLLPDSLHVDTGQVEPPKDNSVEAVELPDFPD